MSASSYRISAATAERMRPLAAKLGWSDNQFAERSVFAMCELCDLPPERRTVPAMVAMLDALRGTPAALPEKITPFSGTYADLAAEKPAETDSKADTQKKKSRTA
jgi:hypothetical protein